MPPLQRHGLVHLGAAGWAQALAGTWDTEARACLVHWAAHRLPLVVTRQAVRRPGAAPSGELALGLPAPACWSRRRLALRVPASAVLYADQFPRMAAVTPLLPRQARARWTALCRVFDTEGWAARVYGSHGWQRMTGLAYLHAASDLDLLVPVESAEAADRAGCLLAAVSDGWATSAAVPRLDGELVFPGGAAVAWREWAAWRAGEAAAVLVKRRDGVALARSLADMGVQQPVAAVAEMAA
ncbi:MAG: malonate decarboxylase holo-[acyl-carrier-protein] synthase [Pseudomonadota bacterium]